MPTPDDPRPPDPGPHPDLKKAREHLTGELAPGKVLTEPPLGRACLAAPAPVQTTLISFRDGSYKKVRALSWKHSQWIHFTLPDGSTVAANPANVNYLHIGCGD